MTKKKETFVLSAIVKKGMGRASQNYTLGYGQKKMNNFTGMNLVPGTLNILLDKPCRLKNFQLFEAETFFVLKFTAFVPGKLKIKGVYLPVYLGRGVKQVKDLDDLSNRLFRLEVYSDMHLRSEFGLVDGDEIKLVVDRDYMQTLDLKDRLNLRYKKFMGKHNLKRVHSLFRI